MYITTKYILIEEIVLQILKKSSHLPHITLLYLYNKKTILGIKVSNINIAYSVSSIQKQYRFSAILSGNVPIDAVLITNTNV